MAKFPEWAMKLAEEVEITPTLYEQIAKRLIAVRDEERERCARLAVEFWGMLDNKGLVSAIRVEEEWT